MTETFAPMSPASQQHQMHWDSRNMYVTKVTIDTVVIESTRTKARLEITRGAEPKKWVVSYHLEWPDIGEVDGRYFFREAELLNAFCRNPDNRDTYLMYAASGRCHRIEDSLSIPQYQPARTNDGSPFEGSPVIHIRLTGQISAAVAHLVNPS